jgi:hypothetical protein
LGDRHVVRIIELLCEGEQHVNALAEELGRRPVLQGGDRKMRIVIETEETSVRGLTRPVVQVGPMEGVDAGPPSAALFQSRATTAATGAGESAAFTEDTDAGAPSPELVQALQLSASPMSATAPGSISEGGAAPLH